MPLRLFLAASVALACVACSGKPAGRGSKPAHTAPTDRRAEKPTATPASASVDDYESENTSTRTRESVAGEVGATDLARLRGKIGEYARVKGKVHQVHLARSGK